MDRLYSAAAFDNQIENLNAIKCPWKILKDLCYQTDPYTAASHCFKVAYLFECNDKTLGVMSISKHSLKTNKVGHKSLEIKYVLSPIRIERFRLLSNPDDLKLFDTIYASTLKDKHTAEIMLEMLGVV